MMKWRGVNTSPRLPRPPHTTSTTPHPPHRGTSPHTSHLINRLTSHHTSRPISRLTSRTTNGRGKTAETDTRKRRGRGKVGRRGPWEGEDMLQITQIVLKGFFLVLLLCFLENKHFLYCVIYVSRKQNTVLYNARLKS